MKIEMNWYNPAENPPPFHELILVMLGGNRSQDNGLSWHKYTQILSVRITTEDVNDDYEEENGIACFESGSQDDFPDYQFIMKDVDGDELDWYSDSILAWAHYPIHLEHALLKSQDSEA